MRRGFLDLLAERRPPSATRRAGRDHTHHQWRAARRVRRTARRERASSASMSRSIHSTATLSRTSRAAIAWRRCSKASTPPQRAGLKIKINTVALKHDNAHEIPELIKWAHARGLRHHFDRNHAARRDRRRPHRSIPVACRACARTWRAIGRLTDLARSHRRARRVTCAWRKPAAGSASSRRSPTISAKAAHACASPARAGSIFASGTKPPSICATPLRVNGGDDGASSGDRCARSRLRPKGHDFHIERSARPQRRATCR